MMSENLTFDLMLLAKKAGTAIMDVYESPEFAVELKNDKSPLTKADLASHNILIEGLGKLSPGIPIISEEESNFPDWNLRKAWNKYWLIDPLDGTKEFIKRNGEFTVNIALIENHRPIAGVVWCPALETGYSGHVGTKQAMKHSMSGVKKISTKELNSKAVTIVKSRSHGQAETQQFLDFLQLHFKQIFTTDIGSSLKICLVAEGSADLYPRMAPTSEWDTAAAQAVLEAAGGSIIKMDANVLTYNEKDSILNPSFLVVGDLAINWKYLLNKHFSPATL